MKSSPSSSSRRMVTRSSGGSKPQKSDKPQWMKALSTRDLKFELQKRINAYFSFPQHRETMDEAYHSFVTNGSSMSTQKLIKVATENLQLKTVKLTSVKYGTLTDKVTFLAPFTVELEKPEPAIVEADPQTETTIENTPQDIGDALASQEISVPDTPTQESVDLLNPINEPSTVSTEWSTIFNTLKEEIKITVQTQLSNFESRTVTLINQVTKDEYANTLRAYHERQKEMKSDARDKASVVFFRRG